MPSVDYAKHESNRNHIPAPKSKVEAAIDYAHQAERLSFLTHQQEDQQGKTSTAAVRARFVTPQDPVIETADGGRLPAVPLAEAQKLNLLRDHVEGIDPSTDPAATGGFEEDEEGRKQAIPAAWMQDEEDELGDYDPSFDENHTPLQRKSSSNPDGISSSPQSTRTAAPLRQSIPPSRTHPLFPPLPLYGPPSPLRDLQCMAFRISSWFLSLAFLAVIVLGAAFTSLPLAFRHIGIRLMLQNPDKRRPFYEEEVKRAQARKEAEVAWDKKQRQQRQSLQRSDSEDNEGTNDGYVPTEGGRDPLVCDIGYYARRVGLDVEEFKVQTEDGFIITLWHVYDPREYTPAPEEKRKAGEPRVFPKNHSENGRKNGSVGSQYKDSNRRYPVLLIHGLLQSAGAYCCNDDDSLAFYLCKSGYDVWLGNNRCGFKPEHVLLEYTDPRMWAWNIRQMGVMDLPAFVSRVLSETGFEKLGLICHSQGTTQTFVALAKEQRPDLGKRISVFCALAPAAYAGPLIGKMYFKFMRVISPGLFRVFFGIHAFIPFMMQMHALLPGGLYGALGYRVFSFLFNWSDDRWDRGIRDRLFQFSPVYVSAESMRWWLGRECFAKQKCILATREEWQAEDAALDGYPENEPAQDHEGDYPDEDDDERERIYYRNSAAHTSNTDVPRSEERPQAERPANKRPVRRTRWLQPVDKRLDQEPAPDPSPSRSRAPDRGRFAWYDDRVPPIALWIAGSDDLVDGRRLLRRFKRGSEPHVRLVHSKLIEEYEHLDVIWAMNMIEKVGQEVRGVIWKTVSEDTRKLCRVPVECGEIPCWKGDEETSASDERAAVDEGSASPDRGRKLEDERTHD